MDNAITKINFSSIRGNHKHGSVGQFLVDTLKPQADLSVVSAYFTIYAYNHLKNQLDRINHLNFLFGEPAFIKALDPARTNKRDFKIEDDKIVIPIQSRLTQKAIARECSQWITLKVDKRLESSIESFEISMDRTIRKIENLESKINAFLASRSKSQEEVLEASEPDEDEQEACYRTPLRTALYEP